MRSFHFISSLTLLILALSFLLTNATVIKAKVADATNLTPPPPLNLTDILKNGTQYNTFMRLLKDTDVGPQVTSLADISRNADGLTILAPTDNAFNGLKPGTLNRLNMQQQSQLILFHVLPKYYSYVMFETTSNPVRTQASGEHGVCTVNITSSSNQVNVSTGVTETSLNNALYLEFPLAVYSIDKVLLLPDLFGPSSKDHQNEPTPVTGEPNKHSPAFTGAAAPTIADATATSLASKTARGLFVGIVLLVVVNILYY